MEDIFNIKDEPIEQSIMISEDYFNKSKDLLLRIENSYSKAWTSRRLFNEEYPNESVCDKCKGEGVFKSNDGEDRDCRQDKEQGECYYRFCDYELVGIELEETISDIHELLSINQLNP